MSKVIDFKTGLILETGKADKAIKDSSDLETARVEALNKRALEIVHQIFDAAVESGFDPLNTTIVFGEPDDIGGLMICTINQTAKVSETLYRLHNASLNIQTLLDRAALDFLYDPDHIQIRDYIDD